MSQDLGCPWIPVGLEMWIGIGVLEANMRKKAPSWTKSTVANPEADPDPHAHSVRPCSQTLKLSPTLTLPRSTKTRTYLISVSSVIWVTLLLLLLLLSASYDKDDY